MLKMLKYIKFIHILIFRTSKYEIHQLSLTNLLFPCVILIIIKVSHCVYTTIFLKKFFINPIESNLSI